MYSVVHILCVFSNLNQLSHIPPRVFPPHMTGTFRRAVLISQFYTSHSFLFFLSLLLSYNLKCDALRNQNCNLRVHGSSVLFEERDGICSQNCVQNREILANWKVDKYFQWIYKKAILTKFILFLGCISPNEFEKHNLKWREINYKGVCRFTPKCPAC